VSSPRRSCGRTREQVKQGVTVSVADVSKTTIDKKRRELLARESAACACRLTQMMQAPHFGWEVSNG
jgi:hypothetical protein